MKNVNWKRRRKSRASSIDPMGPARVDTRTKRLTKRLAPGDIAVINHEDIDLVAAESLVACQPAAVLNAAKSTSGKYPNLGPGILLDHHIPLIDNCGDEIMNIPEGAHVSVSDDGEICVGDSLIASGTVQTFETNRADLDAAQEGMATQLEAFAQNTMEYVSKEHDLILHSIGVPEITTDFHGRHALIVVRGYHYQSDLASLRAYIREYHPVLVGVDGGADAILDIGLTPDLIVGDMDSVSDAALTSGAEIVVHAYRDGKAPGSARVRSLDVPHTVFPMTGTSEDAAMLLADEKGAELIVAVGTHSTLVEFLDKGRKGMASTFLTRLKIGGKLVDAKGASQLYQSRVSYTQLTVLIIAGFVAIASAMATTAAGQTFWSLIVAWSQDFGRWISSLFGG